MLDLLRRSVAVSALVLALTVPAGIARAASPVSLGTADAYAILAGSGMTNTGASVIDGDVGSSPTHSETGFTPCPAANCVVLTGSNHDVADPNDAVTQTAKIDLQTAYDDAFSRTGGAAIVAPLGGGQTLVPGVYTSAANIFVGGDLTLDAGGDPNAVFIFQAKTGTLLTAAGISGGTPNTRVLLTNGAQACNVFWQVGTSATIGTFTQFVGDILADQSITMNTRATLDTGRVLALNGAVTLDTNTIRKAACAPPVVTPATPTPTPIPTEPAPTGITPSPLSIAPPSLVPVPAGSARLTGPTRPVSGPFTVSVTGTSIESVTFYVDGRRRGMVWRRAGRTRFTWKIDPRRQSRRPHRVTVRVRFTAGHGQTTTNRTLIYRRGTAIPPVPRFAG